MDIKLYNTLSRSIEPFTPLKEGAVSMYHCGPTVYDTPHIGNYRTFVMNDLIRRAFEYNGYVVDQAMNITDVDDKTIRRSREEGVSLETVTRKYEDLFIEGLKSLNVLLPHHLIRATDHIADMISLIEKLIEKGVVYKSADGVYMAISKVKEYGVLANLKLDKNSDDTSHQRIANDEYDKDNPHDFALWKFKTEQDGDNSWDASFGTGRPGWHIECSAMAMKVFGETADIHTGGMDLIFPHHTNEIAQSESATGKQFARYWMHGAFITMADEKMAKSKGNIAKLETLEEDMISPLAYRYWLLTAHYRSPVNFTLEAVRGAQNALIKLMTTVSNLPDGGAVSEAYKGRFVAFINDDLGMAQAVALVWELLKDASVSDADKRATVLDFDRVFGLKLGSLAPVEEEKVPIEVQALADAREEARKAKEWDKADALRIEIENRGYSVSDTPSGIKIVSK
ncbi:MAG: cysteinyl-tRNA synthetase [Candidatus Parcubacteria bacterium]|jgi:cysteinyl-tRNA synthetase